MGVTGTLVPVGSAFKFEVTFTRAAGLLTLCDFEPQVCGSTIFVLLCSSVTFPMTVFGLLVPPFADCSSFSWNVGGLGLC